MMRHASHRAIVTRVASLTSVLILLLAVFGCAKKVTVPNVVDQQLDQARSTLTAASLKPIITGGSAAPGAYVVSQTPAPGQQVAANTSVTVAIASPVPVPQVTDTSLADALMRLQTVGLRVSLVKKPTANVFSGSRVVNQDIAPNTLVRHDTNVTLTVTAPPDVTALLNLMTKEPAYQQLNPEYRGIVDAFLGNGNASPGRQSSN
jgi:beta-lactam-binding protein with PASTA domain